MMMLDELDEIEWSKIKHVRGYATEVPRLIRDLLSTDEKTRKYAIEDLFGHALDDANESTLLIIPFILELLNYDETPDQDVLLWELFVLANISRTFVGDEYVCTAHQAQFSQKLYDKVNAGQEIYRKLLANDNEWVRHNAKELLDELAK